MKTFLEEKEKIQHLMNLPLAIKESKFVLWDELDSMFMKHHAIRYQWVIYVFLTTKEISDAVKKSTQW